MMRRWWLIGAACALMVGGAPAIAGSQALAAGAPVLAGATQTGSNVLLVCNGSTKPCPPSTSVFSTVQGAVNAARPGDWILIWPGVYHEKSTQWPTAGVWIQKPGLHIRGLDRNQVIIDGSNGTAGQPCPSSPALQDTNGGAGRDGIVVWKASGVTIQNLTVCDYLSGTGGHGNEIWWNGGDTTGKIGMSAYRGSYLSATSMYGPSNVNDPNLAQYGIFVSNARGPGVIEHSYGSNMADAAYYVGACQRVCHATLTHDTGTNSNLGYSGTNAGGPLVIKDSVFSSNRAGIVPNSLNNDDAPPPQNGACPGTTKSCFFIEHNVIKNNNNPNAPTSGLAGAIGTGVEISGGAYDTVRDNLFIHNGAWGVVTHDFPDTETPPPGSHCQGGIQVSPQLCDFPAHGNRVHGNFFTDNGFFGNATNGDLATVGLLPNSATPRNCFYGNSDAAGRVTSEPKNIQTAAVDGRPCGKQGTSIDGALVSQLTCAAEFGPCPPGAHYPKQTKITIVPLPTLPTMPSPCAGVPANPFCSSSARRA
ncbi:MAG TPA: hypothetical protein VFJ07_02535 [Streptosporangiaceae bacterium]|nr:hypothetical protein [Streptosporangiaceae bacterium]